MKLQEVKNLREYSKRFWSELPKGVQPDIIIENDISGSFESATTRLGSKVKRFKPWTQEHIWSHWRVGVPVRWKGKTLIIWLQGIHGERGDHFWTMESIWDVKREKALRKDAEYNCWEYISRQSKRARVDVSGLKLSKCEFRAIPMAMETTHNGVDWVISPSTAYTDRENPAKKVIQTGKGRGYYLWHKASERIAMVFKTQKDAKIYIINEGGAYCSRHNLINQ